MVEQGAESLDQPIGENVHSLPREDGLVALVERRRFWIQTPNETVSVMTQPYRIAALFLVLPLSACLIPGDYSGRGVEEVVKTESPDSASEEIEVNFDPCEEIRRQLADSRRAFSIADANELTDKRKQCEQALRDAELEADESRNLARKAANDHLQAQNELRRVEALRSDEADAFCREVLELSGIGKKGSLTMKEAPAGRHWEAFSVLEDPPTDVYYLEVDEEPNEGERCRIALQETMFTEFPKYWDRTRETRDRLNLATLDLASTLREKREAEEAAGLIHDKIQGARERWYAACDALQRANNSLLEMLELEQSLERCAGGEGLAGRIQRIELRLMGLELRATDALDEFDRTREEVFVVAPPGYREGSEKHLEASWELLGSILDAQATVRGYLDRAMHAFADELRDEARDHANRAQRGCDEIEGQLSQVSKYFERARFAASEGQATYFQDGPETRHRNATLSRMDLDYILLTSLRDALQEDEGNPAWTDLELWSSLPAWLSAYEESGLSRVPEEAYDSTLELVTFVEENFRPCEPKARGFGVLNSFLEGGHAKTEKDAYLLLGELCGLMRRLNSMLAED